MVEYNKHIYMHSLILPVQTRYRLIIKHIHLTLYLITIFTCNSLLFIKSVFIYIWDGMGAAAVFGVWTILLKYHD